MTSLDASRLRSATAANHRAWFRRCAATRGGLVERPAGIELAAEPPWGTIAFPGPRARSAARVDQVMRRARELGVDGLSCWSLDEDPALEALLVERGFEVGWQPHWMAVELDRLPEDGPPGDRQPDGDRGFEIVPFQPAPGDRRLPYTSPRPDPARTHHLSVRADEQTVGHVMINVWRGYAGIYNMGVVEERRREGIGRALTLAACRVGRRAGCTHALLNATPEGEMLYRTVGFQSLGWGRTWWLHPQRCRA